MKVSLTQSITSEKCVALRSGSKECVTTIFVGTCPVERYDVPHHAVDDGCKKMVTTMKKNTTVISHSE